MAKEYMTVTNGTFTFQESDDENVFYFYRNDGEVLTDVGNKPMDFYQAYIMRKMMDGNITDMVANNLCMEKSSDGKVIKVTVRDIFGKAAEEKKSKKEDLLENNIQEENSTVSNNKPGFWKRFFQKIFG